MNKTFTIQNTLQAICNVLSGYYGQRIKNYGEATASLLDDQAANYISIDGQQFCSVNDAYDVVVFFIRQSASPTNQSGPGRNNTLTRNVSFKMVCNVRDSKEEFAISTLINSATHTTYTGSDFDSKGIASAYFGLVERDYHTSFFTIDFDVVEKIICQPC